MLCTPAITSWDDGPLDLVTSGTASGINGKFYVIVEKS
jgi:hypothetical protein